MLFFSVLLIFLPQTAQTISNISKCYEKFKQFETFFLKTRVGYACIPLVRFIVVETEYFLSGKQMNYHYPISITLKNALNFTFETKIRVTRFAPVKTLYLFNCKYPSE